MGHIHTPLAFLHATPRRLLLGDAGSILPSPSFIATDLNWIYSDFFFLSLPCHVAAANSHPRDPFLLRTPRHALADVLHDSARSTRVTRTSSLSCVRRSRRPHAHCFYCTRVRFPSTLPDYLCGCGASLLPLTLPPHAQYI
ncbi:hypothetical protein B0H13DRAFT_2325240 [Mycena leptocephala]|nr:hypothetical protein B0H13DRAFT_2325240 [Mycena leptocephala]